VSLEFFSFLLLSSMMEIICYVPIIFHSKQSVESGFMLAGNLTALLWLCLLASSIDHNNNNNNNNALLLLASSTFVLCFFFHGAEK